MNWTGQWIRNSGMPLWWNWSTRKEKSMEGTINMTCFHIQHIFDFCYTLYKNYRRFLHTEGYKICTLWCTTSKHDVWRYSSRKWEGQSKTWLIKLTTNNLWHKDITNKNELISCSVLSITQTKWSKNDSRTSHVINVFDKLSGADVTPYNDETINMKINGQSNECKGDRISMNWGQFKWGRGMQ